MKYDGSVFKNRKFDFEKLQNFGFTLSNSEYSFKTKIFNDTFELIIKIKNDETIDIRLIESALNEDYNLIFVKSAQGEFIGKVREELESILLKIKDNCTVPYIFKTKQAKQIIEYIKKKYNDSPEFLWEKFPDNCIFRKKDNSKNNGKWYAVILTVVENKIKTNGSLDKIEIIDLKLNPDKLIKTVDNKKYFKGYHMNKKHWYTICLDDSISISEIKKRIDESYSSLC